ncbi:MAG: cryptochrome/photolyase family protein, partial [Xanthomonadales bacterium]|nr:cryptochrome/photolyase family protein [Xanthomonadales bacterium]
KPNEVIEAAIAQFQQQPKRISLASVEGFIRQILGWREYIRGMYWANADYWKNSNALAAMRPLPQWFWNGQTRMNCLHQSIKQSLQHAYAHHIQRLMIVGNFSLLAGLSPSQVDAWYLGIYIDAIEWVEQPNTRGMALFSDGGLIASKPYAASANYINKMSDYCQSCHYRASKKTGARACPMNSLYWHFLARHQDQFANNPRMSFAYKSWQRMDPAKQQALIEQANDYLAHLDEL